MHRLLGLDDPRCRDAARVGAKASRLARARRAGLPVLPGWAVPVAEARPALRAGAAAVRASGAGGARRAVLGHRPDAVLTGELATAAARLGGRVIVRSSSPLERDPRWSGAFASLGEVTPADVALAVRSCWASSFARDPLRRLEACGLDPAGLDLGVLIQPELRPDAGGTARFSGDEIRISGIDGHPAPLLSGWSDGATARVRAGRITGDLADLIGSATVTAVAALARTVRQVLSDDTIEWATSAGAVHLLQSTRTAPTRTAPTRTAPTSTAPTSTAPTSTGPVDPPPPRERPPDGPAPPPDLVRGHPGLATVLARGYRVPATPVTPGDASGPLLYLRPHTPAPSGVTGSVLLVDRPLPALAPLLFAAHGLIARSGPAVSHLSEVARCLGVPMVVGCHPETIAGALAAPGWHAAIDGTRHEVALLPPG
ncbi:MAG TPA: PEP/pyruvate-binding domain-containing protein [Streptosporangiaceae bacterium]|jgi:hypothetical protein